MVGRIAVLIAALGVPLAACRSTSSDMHTVTVFAASSLTEVFTEIGAAYQTTHPGTTVTFNFAASSSLATQITEGAPADVFAAADTATMQGLQDGERLNGEPSVFATNSLEIITEPGNPNGIASLADLANPDLAVVLADPQVPIGKYTAEVLAKAGVTVVAKSLEQNVKSVVGKVTLGEADAGIVYVTDVLAAGKQASGVEVPAEVNVIADYPIAVTKTATADRDAAAFVAFVLSPEGQRILKQRGFGPTVAG
jgi:molybdate transport system substrate-binding protein